MSFLRKFSDKSLFTTRFFIIANAFSDKPTNSYYDDLINTAGSKRDLETVRYLFNKRRRDGCFNIVNTFKFITNTEHSLSILDDLYKALARIDKGFARKNAFASLIARLCKLRKTDEALCVVDIMAEGEFGLNVCSFHPLLSVLTRKKKVEDAWQLIELMKQVKVSPDITAYNFLLTACCFNRNLTAASDVLKKIEENGLVADARTYDALVLGACRVGKVEEAFVLMRRMVDDGQSGLYSTFAHVNNVLLELGYYAQAVKFMMVCGGRGIKLDTKLFGTLASKLIGLGRFDHAKFILKEMDRRGLKMGHKLRDYYESMLQMKTKDK